MNFLHRQEILSILTEHIQVLYDHTKPDGTFNCKLGGLEEVAAALIELESGKQPRATGWWVMLRRNEKGDWETLGFVDDMADEMAEAWEEQLPPFEVIMPIPDPADKRLREWDGF